MYPERPLIGVGAVLFTPALDKVLLIQRGAEPSKGLWSFPGGLLELGERLREACQREVFEETGLEVELQGLAKVTQRMMYDQQNAHSDDQGERLMYHFVILSFWGVVKRGTPVARSDAADVKWVPIDQVARFPTTRGATEVITHALQLACGELAVSPLLEG
jgi:ADP-ribose pyrophosphatase YjhB (NUDIX family)